ncbi:2-keto-3-deoxygluconate kinase [Nocardia asteroides]|uniref:2-keto-3-deoxygluconate kinase n=1 Tax=Nocardia asteroides TaxID=1824 RepID=UPI001E3CEB87|nr:2-keto-3-deoxygluconate kinase [Nocardia asteroides]UGT54674.1 2-keto-3-deoxygluconate kinase [Nocardia asteroides]
MTLLTLDRALFDAAPRGLRAETDNLTPAEFLDRYTRIEGPITLGEFTCSGTDFTATLEFADHLRTVISAGNPVAAMTSALYDEGYPLEILQFHQRRTAAGTATFVQCEVNGRRGWAAAMAADGAGSTVRAMIACVNLLAS